WGGSPPEILEWDGRGNDASVQPEGTYDYMVFGEDTAGNKTVLPLPGINLSRKVFSVFLTPDRKGFSPAAREPFNELRFIPAISVHDGLQSWDLKIRDKKLNILREF